MITTTSSFTTEESTTDATTDMTTTSEFTTIASTTESTTAKPTTDSSTTKLPTSQTSTAEPLVSNPPAIITVPEEVPATDHINITAAIVVIDVVVPVNFSMEFPVTLLAGTLEYFSFLVSFPLKVGPYYENTEGYQSIEGTRLRPADARRKRQLGDTTEGTIVDYEVKYDYKKLERAGGVQNIADDLEKDVKAGIFTVDNITAKNESLDYSTESEILAVVTEQVIQQVAQNPGLIQAGVCAVTNCPKGYECKNDTTGKATCATKCTDGYCYNEGTCFHVENQPVYCSCSNDPTGFYVGARCEFYASQTLVIGVTVGVGSLMIIIIIVVSVCRCRRPAKKETPIDEPREEVEATWLSPVSKRKRKSARGDSYEEELPLYTIANRKRTTNGGRTNPEAAYIVYGEEQMLGTHALSGQHAANGHRQGWKPSLQNIPVGKELKIPRPGLYEGSNNYWHPIDGRVSVSSM
ncbi:uncharacterized protein [Branchiostoma lanceolatum]|uniref:uncharacterized protein n=1 Tax=Branchiostoma lanceolatum TaxID=7740 RepID=UPI003453F9E9